MTRSKSWEQTLCQFVQQEGLEECCTLPQTQNKDLSWRTAWPPMRWSCLCLFLCLMTTRTLLKMSVITETNKNENDDDSWGAQLAVSYDHDEGGGQPAQHQQQRRQNRRRRRNNNNNRNSYDQYQPNGGDMRQALYQMQRDVWQIKDMLHSLLNRQ